MASVLIAVIYLTFVSLGLPDSLLGAAWPVMSGQLHAQLSWAGIVSMIITGGTVFSSLLSDRLTRKLGTPMVTVASVSLTAIALVGFSVADAFWQICLIAVPYGLGAGAVDAALNNYVAIHYDSKAMNWLHCFWGVGATVGPYIMGWAIGAGHGWRTGYGTVAVIQIALTALLFATLPLWKGQKGSAQAPKTQPLGLKSAVKIPGVKAILIAFFAYSSTEATAGLWASSYLVEFRGVNPVTASNFAALFYLGMTAGRFFSGFIADRLRDHNMIRLGAGVLAAGVLLILLPLPDTFALVGLVIAGLGAAPIYPAIIHSTPIRFGKENSQAIVGIQMAAAYSGSTLMPPLFGILGQYLSMGIYPVFLLITLCVMTIMIEKANRFCPCND